MDYENYEDIPEPVRKAQAYIGVYYATRDTMHFSCASFESSNSVLHLCDAIVDSSDKVQGVVLQKRRSHHSEMWLAINVPWMIRPWAPREGK